MIAHPLPDAPNELSGPVKAWSDKITLPTWEPLPGERNPMFLEKRVYQGSSGRVYPLPFVDRIADAAVDRAWQAYHLENEYVRVMILPELGGRIHRAYDKTNGYDFVYRQDVIKPALVGLAGPWISGGIEFNWPQHHRPSTYLPVETFIEREADGTCTVWLSSLDPQSRMKGMHGVCLRPGKAYIELRVRLYNPTPLTQSFLWWANVATEVNASYQSFFPEDVHFVADHAKRAVSTYPLCSGTYYGVDYAARAAQGISADEKAAAQYLLADPPYPANDLSWYANIPVPTSYMCLGSSADFFGAYDHAAKAGILHIANHHIAPGKKQWTWGNHAFGYAWDRQLTVPDAETSAYRPYIELMAGVYTDNQPDFSFLQPGESRVFTQYWYPFQAIGVVHAATIDVAVHLACQSSNARIGVAVTAPFAGATIILQDKSGELAHWQVDLAPDAPFTGEADLTLDQLRSDLTLRVATAERELIVYTPDAPDAAAKHLPAPASEAPAPSEIASSDELFLTGLHLDQYRHATRPAEIYWQEALRRDPADARCNNAMGLWRLRRGEFAAAQTHFQTAIERLTARNPNPADGEAFYNLGVCLRYQTADDQAYDAFYKATWNAAWRAAAYLALAEIDAARAHWSRALEHLEFSLRHDTDNLRARNLKVIALRQLGRHSDAQTALADTLALDPLDSTARWLDGQTLACDTATRIDMAIYQARAGQFASASSVLQEALPDADPGTRPMLYYYLGSYAQRQGEEEKAQEFRQRAAQEKRDYCFPAQLDELVVLNDALHHAPDDASAHYFLGNLLYDKRRHQDAISHWEESARRAPDFPTVWRNLGIARFNILNDADAAQAAYERAFALDPSDARVFYERDQLWKRIGIAPEQRLLELERQLALVSLRDDLCVELCALYNHTGAPERTLKMLSERPFQPWEGGEGQALGQYVRARLLLGRRALGHGQTEMALAHFMAALNTPENLGEVRHLLANPSDILYWLGVATAAHGKPEQAKNFWQQAAAFKGDFQSMSVQNYSELSYFSALALAALGQHDAAKQLLHAINAYADELLRSEARIDYFATSLPTMLLFADDLQKRQSVMAYVMKAQVCDGLEDAPKAKEYLAKVLALDPNQAVAIDLLAEK